MSPVQWAIAGAHSRSPEDMRERALRALQKLLDLPGDRLLDGDTLLSPGDEIDFQFVDDPMEDEFYDLTWSVRDNNVIFIVGTLAEYSTKKMMHCFDTKESGDVLDTASFDERLRKSEEPLSIEDANELVRGLPVIRWQTLWERRFDYDAAKELGRPVSIPDY